jgi:hypothetical protein
VVQIAAAHQEFLEKCRAALQNPNEAAIARGLAMARSNTWDGIVAQLEAHLDALPASRL